MYKIKLKKKLTIDNIFLKVIVVVVFGFKNNKCRGSFQMFKEKFSQN